MRYLLILMLLALAGCSDVSTKQDSVDMSTKQDSVGTPSVFVGATFDEVWCLYGIPDESQDGVWYYKRLGNSRYGAVLYFDEDGILYRVRIVR